MQGPSVGSAAPTFSLRDLRGEEITLDSLRAAGKPVVLLFIDPDCGPCNALLPEMGRWQQKYAEKLTISLVSRGEPEVYRTRADEHGLRNFALQEDSEVADAYGVWGTPSAVLVSADGAIGSPMAAGEDAIVALLARAAGERPQLPMHQPEVQETQEPVPEVGDLAPEVKLPDLEGRTVGLEDFKGQETLMLFWSPGCGFCMQMLPELKEREADPPEGAPRLLIVSEGSVEENEAMGLSSTVLLDNDYAASDAFGVGGTPSAVLVDAEGRIASEVVGGATAVLELAKAGRTAS
jgi:peroxiredoxin